MKNKIVFISYSWDSESHKEWVLKLGDSLVSNGVDVILDQYELSAGKEMTHFMEKSLTVDKILMILTPNYKAKADNRQGGVGYEYSLYTQEYYEKQYDKTKIIPILRTGDKNTSSPSYIKTRMYHDMRNDNLFDSKLFEFIKIILDKPLVKKPPLGKVPDFEKDIPPDTEKRLKDYQVLEKIVREKRAIINSTRGVEIFQRETRTIFEKINSGIEHYRSNFNFPFHIIPHEYDLNYLLSTVHYTFFYKPVHYASNSAHDSHIILNFFIGPVGLEEMGIDYDGPKEVIFKKKYFFELDDNKNTIWVNEKDKGDILKTEDIDKLIFRELINNEINYREKKLRKK